jgi:hypothetical protein
MDGVMRNVVCVFIQRGHVARRFFVPAATLPVVAIVPYGSSDVSVRIVAGGARPCEVLAMVNN